MNPRCELLRPLVTPAIEKLARKRLLESRNLFRGETLRVRMARSDVKLALLLVAEANPREKFSCEEEALLAGVCSKTLRAERNRAELVRRNRV